MQNELDRVVGRGRQPTTTDRPDLPYCDATLMEVMRIRPVLPVLSRVTSANVTLEGFFIPKGAMIMSNVWAVHHGSKYWSKPHIFNPDRFLTADGLKVEKNEAWLAFGTGNISVPNRLPSHARTRTHTRTHKRSHTHRYAYALNMYISLSRFIFLSNTSSSTTKHNIKVRNSNIKIVKVYW